MGVIEHLINGFSVSFQPMNLFFCFLGVVMGTLIGVLPTLVNTMVLFVELEGDISIESDDGFMLR